MRDRDRFGRHDFRHGFVGWAGPVFWPYAYNNLFDYTFWPYDYSGGYYDPFWNYGYDDLFAGIFSPYDAGYGYGYGGTRRHRHTHVAYGRSNAQEPVTAAADAAQLCERETASVVEFPFDEIVKAVQPTAEQQAKLNDLRNAAAKANDVLKGSCPTEPALTPVGRLDIVEKRLGAMLEAVDAVRKPLKAFHDSLTDEQKARLDQLGQAANSVEAKTGNSSGGGPDQICGQQSNGVVQLPIDEIAKAVAPDDTQKTALEDLRKATASAAESLKGSCPTATPLTVTGRLDAVQKRLQAMLDAVKTVRPSLEKFYASLSDEQKARFNTMGRRQQG